MGLIKAVLRVREAADCPSTAIDIATADATQSVVTKAVYRAVDNDTLDAVRDVGWGRTPGTVYIIYDLIYEVIDEL